MGGGVMQGPAGPFALHTAAAAKLARTSKGWRANFQRWPFGFFSKALLNLNLFFREKPLRVFWGAS